MVFRWMISSLSLFARTFVLACGGDDNGDVSVPEVEEGTDWDLGNGLVVTGINSANLVYNAATDDVCEHPNKIFLTTADPYTTSRLDLTVEFFGDLPCEFSFADVVPGITNGVPDTFEHNITLVDGEQIMPATAGTGSFDVNKPAGWVQITLVDVTFRDKVGVYSGTVGLDLEVYCQRLAPESIHGGGDCEGPCDCAWRNDEPPAETTFCQEMTSGFTPDFVH